MDPVLALALVLPWGVVAFEGWLIYLLLRQRGRALLDRDALDARLDHAEQQLGELADGIGRAAPAERSSGHDDGAVQLPAGLPVGSPAPEFALPDLEGHERALHDFLGRPLLLVFFSPQCGYCLQMASRLGRLSEGEPRVLLVSRGDADEHRRLAEEYGWRCDVVLEKEWEISAAYRASGTPTGYLVDAWGRIASSLAVGADAVFRLASAPSSGSANGHGGRLTAQALREKERAAVERARTAGLPVRESRLNREGLRAGTPAPDFRLPDLAGRERSLAELRGKRVLLVFSDPDCGPCQVLAPELVKLHQQHRAGDLEVVMVARGNPEANRAKAKEHGFAFPVLLQRHWEVSKEYAMFATPVGYLVDEHGVVAKDVAVGADAILQLV